jgi:hypothetical protein
VTYQISWQLKTTSKSWWLFSADDGTLLPKQIYE